MQNSGTAHPATDQGYTYDAFDTAAYGVQEDKTTARDSRSVFQRDRDRVIFSYAFRRLQSKTQVFQSGQYDFYRTRLTHSLEVARIARSIGEELAKRHPDFQVDGDLLEAVGLAHDLGHPPFGHIGERKLNELMQPWGGFEGNAQTVRILTELFWERDDAPTGMKPSRAFLDGVMKYKALWRDFPENPENHFLYDEQEPIRTFVAGQPWPATLAAPASANAAKSLECQIMDWADDTAYSLHDIVDGVKAGFITRPMVESWAEQATGHRRTLADSQNLPALLDMIGRDFLEAKFAKKVGGFLRAVHLEPSGSPLGEASSRHRWRLCVPEEIRRECELYKTVALDLVFRSPRIQQVEFKSGFLLERLFHVLCDNHLEPGQRPLAIIPRPGSRWIEQEPDTARRARRICDYLAQLTDHEALRLYRRLFDPDFGTITDLL